MKNPLDMRKVIGGLLLDQHLHSPAHQSGLIGATRIMVNERKSSSKKSGSDNYAVEFVDIRRIKPSPENDDIYGKITNDDQMDLLIDSIKHRGLEEPIIVSADNFIISGHRRFSALQQLNLMQTRKSRLIPVRRKPLHAKADYRSGIRS